MYVRVGIQIVLEPEVAATSLEDYASFERTVESVAQTPENLGRSFDL